MSEPSNTVSVINEATSLAADYVGAKNNLEKLRASIDKAKADVETTRAKFDAFIEGTVVKAGLPKVAVKDNALMAASVALGVSTKPKVVKPPKLDGNGNPVRRGRKPKVEGQDAGGGHGGSPADPALASGAGTAPTEQTAPATTTTTEAATVATTEAAAQPAGAGAGEDKMDDLGKTKVVDEKPAPAPALAAAPAAKPNNSLFGNLGRKQHVAA